MGRRDKLIEIDILKSIAITLILLYHMDNYASVNYLIFTHPYLGRIGVGMFTFISGYALYHNYQKITCFNGIKNFYKKRIIRIFPLYCIAFFLYIPLFKFLGRLTELNTTDFLITLTGNQILLGPAFLSYRLPVLWYIGLIMALYSIYPFLIFFSKNNKEILINSITIFAFFITIRLIFNIIEVRFFLYYFIFIGGILIKSIDVQTNRIYRQIAIIIPFIFMIFLFIRERIIPYDANEEVLVREEPVSIIISLFGLLLSFILLSYDLIISSLRYMSGKFLKISEYLATASYPIFLFHPVILYPQRKLLYPLMENNPLLYDIFIFTGVIPLQIILCYYIQIYENLSKQKFNKILSHFKLKIHEKRQNNLLLREKIS